MSGWQPKTFRPADGWQPKSFAPDVPDVGAGETFINKAVNMVPLGRLLTDGVASGVVQALRPSPGATLTPQAQAELEAMGGQVAEAPGLVDTYRDVRDTRRLRTEAGAEQNPRAAIAGSGTGLVLSLLAPLPKTSVGAVRGANGTVTMSRGAQLGNAVLTGAGYGGVAGLTDGSADLTRGDVAGTLEDTAKGTAWGAGAGAAGYGLVRGVQRLAGKVGDVLRGRATQAEDAVRAQEAAKLAEETASVQAANRQAVRNTAAEYAARVEERRERLAQQTAAKQARADDAAAKGLISEAEAARASAAAQENKLVLDRAKELLRRVKAGDTSDEADALTREAEEILSKAEARAAQEASAYASTHRNLLSTYMDSGRPLPEGAASYAASVYDDAGRRVAERASQGSFDPGRVYNSRLDDEVARAAALETEAAALRAQSKPDTQQLAQQVVGELQPAGPVVDTPEQAAIRAVLRARGITRDPATVPVPSADAALRTAQQTPRLPVPDYQGGRARLPALKPSPQGTVESRTAAALQRGRDAYQRTSPLQGTAAALSDGNPLKAAAQLTTLPQIATLVRDPLARAAWLKDTAAAATWAQGQVLARTNPEVAARVSSRLAAALQRGPEDYKATHYVLQQQDPEYRQAMQQAQGQDLTEEELRLLGVR